MKKTRAVHTSINEQLFKVVRSGSTKDVERCLSMGDCDPLARDDDGYTALMWAVRNGHEDCVRLLLPLCDPLAKTDIGMSALMWAAYYGHEACVRALLPVSDPLARSNHGRSAVMWAAKFGHEECVRFLLPVSDPLAKDKNSRSMSQIAIDHGHSEVAGMIDAYVLALNEEALLSTEISPAPPSRNTIIRL